MTCIFVSQRRDVSYNKVAKDLAMRVVVGPVSTPQLIQLTRVYVSDRDGHYQHLVFAVEIEQVFVMTVHPLVHRLRVVEVEFVRGCMFGTLYFFIPAV